MLAPALCTTKSYSKFPMLAPSWGQLLLLTPPPAVDERLELTRCDSCHHDTTFLNSGLKQEKWEWRKLTINIRCLERGH
jgi:hypothetical protein